MRIVSSGITLVPGVFVMADRVADRSGLASKLQITQPIVLGSSVIAP
jgi:hypothetical protein